MKTRLVLFMAAALLTVSAPLVAHHGFAAEYNIADLVVLKGTLSSFDWVNPHAFLTIAVKDDNGGMKLWRIEGGPISFVKEAGWTPEMLQQLMKSRDPIIVTGYRARKSPNASLAGGAWAKQIELSDGRKLQFHD
jgi:hypothetical protein